MGSTAAGCAAFAASFSFYTWLTHDAGPSDAKSRAERLAFAIDTSTAIAAFPIQSDARVHLASVEAGGDFALRWRDAPSEARVSFSERFVFDRPEASLQASVSFDDRFGGEALASRGPVRSAPAAPRATVERAATTAPKRAPKVGFQLASASETSLPLRYAPADSASDLGLTGSLKALLSKGSDLPADVDTSRTAIYDITSHTVYLPNGRRLEAHSGLGSQMDDPRSVAMKNIGVTPPNVYDLEMRESLFHGVRAIRLIPKDESKMHGRAGILAHSYMLGPNGQSNGCLSFSDYSAFLDAYLRGDVTRVVVVEHLDDVPSPKTAADWFSNTLKDIFRRS